MTANYCFFVFLIVTIYFWFLYWSGCLQVLEVVFHSQEDWDSLPYKEEKLRLSSIFEKLGCLLFLGEIEVFFRFQKIEFVIHISSSWVKIKLHTKNQLPRLPITKLRSSSIWRKKWGRLLFSKQISLSSIFHLVNFEQCCIPKISSLGCL